ncbi:MAG TPA: hypothetical protein VK658_16610 [Chryseolinea sp.]|nr:hypothetical protein [Chryseolinea sp.]
MSFKRGDLVKREGENVVMKIIEIKKGGLAICSGVDGITNQKIPIPIEKLEYASDAGKIY